MDEVSYYDEYNSLETDPYGRLLNLKQELIQCKNEMDVYASKYKNYNLIRETDEYTKAFEEVDIYKSKLDAIINYKDLFNENNENTENFDLKSNYERYKDISENLISQIKSNENDILTNQNNDNNYNIKYELFANSDAEIDNISKTIDELEELVTKTENDIGDWANVNILKFYFFSLEIMKVSVTL